MHIDRKIEDRIKQWMNRKEIIIVYGARQIGKTTFLKDLVKKSDQAILLNCEQPVISEILESRNANRIKALFADNKIICLDEAQSILNIGRILKLIYDEMPEYKLIVTGSSSFEIANLITEPLTGRNIKFKMYPLTINEISNHSSWISLLQDLDQILIYGSYPEIYLSEPEIKKQKLLELSSDYIFKDILKFENLRYSDLLRKLLKALALQIGSEVSTHELSNEFGVSRDTIERYLDLLEKSFIIFSIPSFSKNLRNELKKSRKYYFIDNGLRNALINNFSNIENRTDKGQLWENFCVAEILKTNAYSNKHANLYFWRTYDQAEIDLIEEYDGAYDIWEFKWNSKKKVRFPKSFEETYEIRSKNVLAPEKLYVLKSN